MTLLARTAETLDRAGVAYAAIGGVALATHGLCRSTFGVDLLAVDERCLQPGFWPGQPAAGVEVRRSSGDEPFAGVVRLRQEGERAVDVLVGRHAWLRDALDRATPIRVLDAMVPVVDGADLVLLKLFAGGALDAWDVAQLLEMDDDGRLAGRVGERLSSLPPDATELWQRLTAR